MNFQLPQIYPITDTRISGLSHAEQVTRLIAGGARLIQLREKHASPRDFYEAAAQSLIIARESGVRVIINDRVDIALALNADGVHLGQDDLPPDQARSILGDDAIIGFSTHSIRQAEQARNMPVSYIAIGPIFETRSKTKPDAVVGLSGLRVVREAVGDMPLVAIGGINSENLASVFAAGADSAAMIGAIVSGTTAIETQMRRFLSEPPQ